MDYLRVDSCARKVNKIRSIYPAWDDFRLTEGVVWRMTAEGCVETGCGRGCSVFMELPQCEMEYSGEERGGSRLGRFGPIRLKSVANQSCVSNFGSQ